jgi:hypothetical protein
MTENKLPVAAAIFIGWLLVTFFMWALAMPALINAHNDGAIIFAIALGLGWLYGTYLTYTHTEDFLQ